MALDKQKILNELGNVVNQLQSADCGCMGKLFSNSNQGNAGPVMSPAHDGYMQGCCHGHCCGHGCHGYNAPGAGEPFNRNAHCMGSCNPPKLYADTYNYLNQNLMQPVVQEVYEDLKSITPNNTMVNNPMAAQMGLTQGGSSNPGGASGMGGGNMGNGMAQSQMPGGPMGNQNATPNMHPAPNFQFGNPNMGANNANAMQMKNHYNQHQMAHMGGVGPSIMNMMKGDISGRPGSMPNQGGQGGTIENNAPQSPDMTGNIMQGQYNAGNVPGGNNPSQYNPGNMGINNIGQGNPSASFQNPTTQYMSQNAQGMPMGGNVTQMNAQGNPMDGGNMARMSAQGNPMAGNTIPSISGGPNPYGQHSAGIAKFNEMFPGLMQGGDLGFDPMAIAIQMNPANQQKAAYDTMQKMMMNNRDLSRANAESLLKPVIDTTNAAIANVPQSNQLVRNQVPPSGHPIQQQQPVPNAIAAPGQNQIPPQQVYTALTGASSMSQQQVPQQGMQSQQQQLQYQQQLQGRYQEPQRQMIDPNTGAVVNTLPTVYEGDPNVRQGGSPPASSAPPTTPGQNIMEPILPADTSRNMPPPNMKTKYVHYNTLGQPVEMLPAHLYQSMVPTLPQTLSPQQVPSRTRSDPTRYSNVKATVSKTSIMGAKSAPSKSQMQHLYNQYKGSHSYTQQNVRPTDNVASYSEGHLNVQQTNPARQAPIERVGGDTAANNAVANPVTYKGDQMPGQVGDVPAANKPPPIEAEKKPTSNSKIRNGLQDQTYTSYATSAAWTFHGATPAPYSTAYRFRYKA